MNENKMRRANDDLDIEAMIAREDDASRRALLLVLSSLATNVAANTRTTESVSASLQAHLATFNSHVEENAMVINNWRGASKVITWLLGIIQMVVISAIIHISTRFSSIESDIVNLKIIAAANHERALTNGVTKTTP